MDYRKIALRILMVSLCIAGICGIAILFLPNAKFIVGRFIVTAILAAIASSTLLLAIKAIESSTYRPLGLSACVLIFLVFISTVSSIWSSLMFSSTSVERLSVSALLLLGCGAVILYGIAFVNNVRLATAGKFLAYSWLSLLVIWLVLIWFFNSLLDQEESIWYVLVPIQHYSVLVALIFISKNFLYRTIGVAFSIVSCGALIFSLLQTAGKISNAPTVLFIVLVTAFIAIMMALWNTITYRNAHQVMPKCEIVTALLAGIALASLGGVIWCAAMNYSQTPDILIRLSASFGILTTTGLFSLIIGRRIKGNSFLYCGTGELHSPCPRCTQLLALTSGHSNCYNCGLKIHLKMESAGCRNCNYDLSGSLNFDVCPECGEPIAINTAIE